MISAVVPMCISLFLAFAIKELKIVKRVLIVICVSLFLFMILCATGLLNGVSFIKRTERPELVFDDSDSFYLTTGMIWNEKKFDLSEGYDRSDLIDWLNNTNTEVSMNISKGDKVLFSKSFGVVTGDDIGMILDSYKSWRSNKSVTINCIRYEFLVFYVDLVLYDN